MILVKAAIAHVYFESIHPFKHRNGRSWVVQHLFCKFRLGYVGQMKKTGMKKGMNLQNRCYTTN